MRIAMPKYKRIWCEEKISYAATSRLFHGTARYLMGFETCSRFLFYTAIIATITISILLHQWTIAAIAVLLWSARFTMQPLSFKDCATNSFAVSKTALRLLSFTWIKTFNLIIIRIIKLRNV